MRLLQPVDLRRHDEIAFGQTIDRMRPQRDLGFAPGEKYVGMVSLFLGNRSHTIHEVERGLEVGELERPGQMMFVDDLPIGNFFPQFFERCALQRRHSTPAGNAGLFGKRRHASSYHRAGHFHGGAFVWSSPAI